MVRRRQVGLVLLGIVLSLGGCCHSKDRCEGDAAQHLSAEALPLAQRSEIEPLLAGLPVTVADYYPHYEASEILPPYRSLDAKQCQCIAAAGSSQANLRDEEREQLDKEACKHHCCDCGRSEVVEAKQDILLYSSLEARNQQAGLALESYFHLAEAEASWNLHLLGVAAADSLVKQTSDQVLKGFAPKADLSTAERQKLDAQEQGIEARRSIWKLNALLCQQLSVDSCEDWRIWPCQDFKVVDEAIDMEAALATGLHERPQLILLRSLKDRLDAASLPAAVAMVQSVDALLGMSEKKPACPTLQKLLLCLGCAPPAAKKDVETRRRQLEELLADRERAVAQDIRQAVHTVRAQIDLVIVARERALNWEAVVRAWEDKGNQDPKAFVELTKAKLEWLRARGKLVKEIMAWEIARSDLKKAQGVLPAECGFVAALPCCKGKKCCSASARGR